MILIRRQPALAVKAALELGWEVKPPPGVVDDETHDDQATVGDEPKPEGDS